MNLGNKLAIAFASVSVCILAVCLFLLNGYDKEPPVISFSQSNAVYRDGMDTKELLEGVEAQDSVDGDVTDRIVIEKITKTSSGKSVIVTYAAGDANNNFSKASRIFQAKETVAGANKNDSRSAYQAEVGAEAVDDVPDAAETEGIAEDSEAEKETEKQSEEEQDAQAADREETPSQEPDERTQEPQNEAAPVLQLNTMETVLKKGTFFNINDYISKLEDDVDTTETLQHRIRTNGDFDNNTPGDYQVTVMVTDSEGNVSPAQNLMIHVVE